MATSTYISNSVKRERQDQVSLTANTTITVGQSGTTFLLDAIGEDITLPAVGTAAGVKYKFICTVTTVTSDWRILNGGDKINGECIVAGALVACATKDVITLVVAKFLPGDWVSLESDGVNWYVAGQVVTAAGCTFTT